MLDRTENTIHRIHKGGGAKSLSSTRGIKSLYFLEVQNFWTNVVYLFRRHGTTSFTTYPRNPYDAVIRDR